MGREKRSDVGARRNRDEDDHGNIEEVGRSAQADDFGTLLAQVREFRGAFALT